jgi:hypothetical protein
VLAGIAGCGAARPAAAGSAVTTAAILDAGPGQVALRSEVPWGRIGPGWALAEDFNFPVKPASPLRGSVILYLVDPRGGRYSLFTWPAKGPAPYGELTDWSGDTRRALAGGLIRHLASPGVCTPVRWWSSSTVLASCAASELTEAGRMWLVPASGAKPTALTPPRPDGPDLSDFNIWQQRPLPQRSGPRVRQSRHRPAANGPEGED